MGERSPAGEPSLRLRLAGTSLVGATRFLFQRYSDRVVQCQCATLDATAVEHRRGELKNPLLTCLAVTSPAPERSEGIFVFNGAPEQPRPLLHPALSGRSGEEP